tara:strand:- start:371 stop:694 length:324 start_codon:yes stop_codon:yes gene_type:complete
LEVQYLVCVVVRRPFGRFSTFFPALASLIAVGLAALFPIFVFNILAGPGLPSRSPMLLFAVSWFPIKKGIAPVFLGSIWAKMEAVNAVRRGVFIVSTPLIWLGNSRV